MIQLTYRPIDQWPGEGTRSRRRSQFSAPYGRTLELLERELHHLQARSIVIQVALDEKDIRLDGRPRASARARHPGVILAFDSKHGPLKYAVDTFTTWDDNIRAIALALEALRRVDRYGVVKRGEQYTGWRQIEQHTGSGFATADEAATWMELEIERHSTGSAVVTRQEILDGGLAEEAYRFLARRLHPDAPGGGHAQFVKLQQARELVAG